MALLGLFRGVVRNAGFCGEHEYTEVRDEENESIYTYLHQFLEEEREKCRIS